MECFYIQRKKNRNEQQRSLRIMKVFLILSFALLINVNARSFSQEAITFQMKNTSIRAVFAEIEKMSDYIFILSDNIKKEVDQTTDVDVNALSINEAVSKVLKNTNLKYSILKKQVVIYKEDNVSSENIQLQAQQTLGEINGTVTDRKGEPLPGVNILRKGFKGGYITDVDGKFTIMNASDTEVLTFSFIGFETKQLSVKKRQSLKVVLQESISEIGEVVITGFIAKEKSSYTGSQTTVTRDQLLSVGTKNVLESIQAFVPGMNIVANNDFGSDPNARPEINIRGRASFEGAANLPLFIVDGARVSLDFIYDMDLNDIETITVLKDASASALYGATASAGVIVITTKSLEGGALKFSYNGTFRASMPDLGAYNLLSSAQKLEYERLAGVYTDKDGGSDQYKLDEQYAKRFETVRSGVDTDWLAMPLRNSISQNHSLSIYGGDENARYNAGIRYGNESGVMKQSGRERLSSFFKLSYNKEQVFYISNTSNVYMVKSTDSPYGSFSQYVGLNPYDTPYDENGELLKKLSHDIYNPIYEASIGNFSNAEQFYVMNTTDIRLWLDKFRVDGSFSFTKHKDDSQRFSSPFSRNQMAEVSDPSMRGSMSENQIKSTRYSGKLMVSYNRNLTDKLFLSTTGGTNIEAFDQNMVSYQSVGFFSDKLAHPSFAARYPLAGAPVGGDEIDRSVGFFVNANAIHDNKYFLDFIYRYEGSSKFGKDSRFAPFWSVGAGWNIHNEKFMEGKNIETLKLRASIGYLGNVAFSPYQSMTTYTYGAGYNYVKGIGAVPITIGNPLLKWERTLNSNVGLDLTFFKRRLDLTVDAYVKNTDNLLLDVTKAPSVGVSTARENIGAIQNIGVEFQTRVVPIRTNYWHWSLSLNYSYNQNKIKKISDALRNLNKENMDRTDVLAPLPIYEEGQSLTAVKVVPSAGIDPATGQEIFIKADGSYTFVYDARDRVTFGDSSPFAYGSLGSFLTYKQYSVNFIFSYSLGGLIYNQTLASRVEGSNPKYNADERVFNDRWKEPGDNAKYKDIANQDMPMQTSRFVETDNYLDLRSLSFAYEFNPSQLKGFSINRMRLEMMTNDLFHISSVKRERGLAYPYSRSFEVSLRVSF